MNEATHPWTLNHSFPPNWNEYENYQHRFGMRPDWNGLKPGQTYHHWSQFASVKISDCHE